MPLIRLWKVIRGQGCWYVVHAGRIMERYETRAEARRAARFYNGTGSR